VFGLSYQRIQLNDLASSALILLALTFLIHATNLFGRVDNLIFDIGQKMTKTSPPKDVIIIAIDQGSLSQIGRWPWSREVHARLLKRLMPEQPAVIGFDVIFSEPDQTNPNADKALADAIAESNNIVLPVLLETVRANGQIIETLPMESLMTHAADVGRVHAVLDEDSIARSVYLYEGLGTPVWQLFSQAVLNVAEKKKTANHFGEAPDQLVFNQFELARKDQRRVNFLGPPGHFNQLSYVQVLNGEFPIGMFNNKILLVGATALGMNDLLTTPVSGLSQPMSGVEFHANVLESLRNNSLIQEAPFWISTFVVLVLSVMPLLWMPRSSALIGFLTTILFMIVVALIAGVLPKLWHIWIPPAATLAALVLAYPIWSWRKLEAAQRFLDVELNYLRQSLTSLPIEEEQATLDGYDQFAARIAQVRTASQQLRFLNEDRKETLAFISHDLRAPLAGAILMLEQHEEARQQLHKPLSQALHLAEDFLQASRAEVMDSASFVEIDLPGLVHQAVDDVYEAAIKNQMELVRDITEDVVWVKGNFNLLHRAILNLIMNAIKYGKSDTQVTVSVGVNQERSHVFFSVMNHGLGISVADQENLFKRYSRIKQHQKLAEGAGLGLYFVRTVAEKHNGSIHVVSDLGKPTTFSLLLPLVDIVSYVE
jgi:CHASE2 domain-containing sensor protein/nitrogen-specific signal transduction histidine kinase